MVRLSLRGANVGRLGHRGEARVGPSEAAAGAGGQAGDRPRHPPRGLSLPRGQTPTAARSSSRDLDRNAKHSELPTDFSLVGCSTALSPDGSLLAVGAKDGRIRLIDLPAGRILVELPEAHASAVALLRWDGDRRLLSWGVEGNFRQWELAESPLREIPTPTKVFRFALSHDGKRPAVTGERNGTVWLVDRTTGSPVQTLSSDGLPTPGLLALSRDGQQLVAAGVLSRRRVGRGHGPPGSLASTRRAA